MVAFSLEGSEFAMGFPITYESRIQAELHQLLVHYERNEWIWYKVSRAPKYEGLRIRKHSDDPNKAGMFEDKGMVASLLDHRGSQSDPNDYKFVINEDVPKNRVNELVAEIDKYSKKYFAE